MKKEYYYLFFIILFMVMTFVLEGTWQLISFLLLILATLPAAEDAIFSADAIYQKNKEKKSEAATNSCYFGYFLKMVIVWMVVIAYMLIYFLGFIASIVTAIGLLYDWCNMILILYVFLYLMAILLRTSMKALFM